MKSYVSRFLATALPHAGVSPQPVNNTHSRLYAQLCQPTFSHSKGDHLPHLLACHSTPRAPSRSPRNFNSCLCALPPGLCFPSPAHSCEDRNLALPSRRFRLVRGPAHLSPGRAVISGDTRDSRCIYRGTMPAATADGPTVSLSCEYRRVELDCPL